MTASTNLLQPKVAFQKPNQFVIVDLCLSPSKELAAGKALRKEIFAWKLLMVVILGICALSMCLIHVGQRNFVFQASCFTHGQCFHNTRQGLQLHFPQPTRFLRMECEKTPVHYFVILSMQRSGSGWFETLLNNHPNINSHGEIFAGRGRHANFSMIARKLDEVYNLDYNSSAVKDTCTSAVGFKWMLNQGVMEYNREISSYFKKRGVSVIFLLRRNLLRRLVSILANAYDREKKPLNGTHKSHVHSKEEADTLAAFKPTINDEALSTNFQRILQVTEDALQAFNSTHHMVVYYEDLVKDQENLNPIQKFLGVSPIKLESQQVKIHTKQLSDQIQNWDSVYKALKGTQFESFLTENEYE